MGNLENMKSALTGLAMGDAFGERYFLNPAVVEQLIESRALPTQAVWRWTDDAAMAISVVDVLEKFGTVDQDALADLFVTRYAEQPHRGYGGGAHRLLANIAMGNSWMTEAPALFDGTGSFGNGGAMRVAPLGAFFCDDLGRVVEEAIRSAQVTHAHPEGISGAVAIAVASAVACTESTPSFFQPVIECLEDGLTKENVIAASEYPLDRLPIEAAAELGAGTQVSAQDTVGFSIWCAQRHPDDFEEAMWATVSGLGDRDTTCAIVGGILGGRLGKDAIPAEWLERLEPLRPSP